MALKLYNTLTKAKEDFVPLESGKVKFYVCGPTVYDYIHIGNARAFVVFDVIRKFLQHQQYEVTYVVNLTDIDDRIIERSMKEKRPTEEITQQFTDAFFEDLEALGIASADFHPKATEHVDEIIQLINALVAKGHAYDVDGDVFFDVTTFGDYGKLSGKKIDDLIAGSRVEVDQRKRHPADFALWKHQKPGEPAWESPWGLGRPGWHIECSAMSIKYLGTTFDIHAGGTDLIFPHHENEIAQSEAATGNPFVRTWLHNGFLNIDGAKMAKSLGNFKRVRDVLKVYSAVAVRLFFLQKHYRGPIDFTQDGLEAAESAASRLRIFFDKLTQMNGGEERPINRAQLSDQERKFVEVVDQHKKQIIEALEDDFNTPEALAHLFDLLRETNKLLDQNDLSENEKSIVSYVGDLFEELNAIFGIVDASNSGADSAILDSVMSLLIEVRQELRAKKEWALADRIRDRLQASGIVLEDKAKMTSWRKK